MNRTDFKMYRFSPIINEAELMQAIEYVHRVCHRLCIQTFGRYLSVRGNVGIFAHYDDELARLVAMREQLTDPHTSYKNKYFRLHRPIHVPERGGIPGATYDFLYIRRVDPYRPQVGDIDFVLPTEEHEVMKSKLKFDSFVSGARLFGRPEENIIELWDPDIDAAAYVATGYMRDDVGKSGF